MNCNFDKNRIIDMVNSDVSATEEHEIIDHINSCIECNEILEKVSSAKGFYNLEFKQSDSSLQYVMDSIDKNHYKKHKIYYGLSSIKTRYSLALKAISLIAASFILFIFFTQGKETKDYNKEPNNPGVIQPTQDKENIPFDDIVLSNIEGKNFKGKLLTIKDSKRVAVGYANKSKGYAQTTSQIAKENGAIAAINAGGFAYDNDSLSSSHPEGIIISNREVIYNSYNDIELKTSVAAFTSEGLLIIGNHSIKDMKKYNIKEAISFSPPLIVNGKPSISNGDGGWGIAPRTAIGQKNNGEVVFLTIDGRSTDSIGATLKDVQDILLDQGVVNALNLDGGSSTTMYYKGEVINKPSNALGERTVPSVFMVLPN